MEEKKTRHYEPKLSLYPMKFEDAVKMIAKARPEAKTAKARASRDSEKQR
jgi:hypothetical protein